MTIVKCNCDYCKYNLNGICKRKNLEIREIEIDGYDCFNCEDYEYEYKEKNI